MVYRHNGKDFNESPKPIELITRFYCVMAVCHNCGKLMRLRELIVDFNDDYHCFDPNCKSKSFGIIRREHSKTSFAKLLRNRDVYVINEESLEEQIELLEDNQ